MDIQHDSMMFLEKVTVPSRRKKSGLEDFRLARNRVPQGCPALVPQKRHRNAILMYPEMSRTKSPESVDRSRYPVFRNPISSRGDIAAGRGLVKSLEIPRESAPRKPSQLSPMISSVLVDTGPTRKYIWDRCPEVGLRVGKLSQRDPTQPGSHLH